MVCCGGQPYEVGMPWQVGECIQDLDSPAQDFSFNHTKPMMQSHSGVTLKVQGGSALPWKACHPCMMYSMRVVGNSGKHMVDTQSRDPSEQPPVLRGHSWLMHSVGSAFQWRVNLWPWPALLPEGQWGGRGWKQASLGSLLFQPPARPAQVVVGGTDSLTVSLTTLA